MVVTGCGATVEFIRWQSVMCDRSYRREVEQCHDGMWVLLHSVNVWNCEAPPGKYVSWWKGSVCFVTGCGGGVEFLSWRSVMCDGSYRQDVD